MADLYLPSLPAISESFAIPINWVQWSVAVFMGGFAFSQLIYGPWSDGIGRKKPLLVGLSLMFLGSIICLTAQSVAWLIIGRFIQGMGAGSGVTLSRTIMRDVFSGSNLAKFASYLSVAGVPIMAGAPLLGGVIQHSLGWRANFGFLALYTLAALLVVLIILPETNLHQDKKHLKWQQLRQNLLTLFKSRLFIGLSVVIFLTYAGILAWLTAGPVLLQIRLGLTPVEFGFVTLITGVSYGVVGLLNGKLVGFYGLRRLMSIGLSSMLCGALLMLLLSIIIKTISLVIIVIPMVIFYGGTGLVFANAYAGVLIPFPQIAGITGSLFGFMQIAGGAVASAILAHLHEKTQQPLALVISIAAIIALTTFLLIKDYIVER